jgi:hypothetical protein
LFKKLLLQKKEDYSYYVIIPHFIDGGENVPEIINMLPKDKLILLDNKVPGVSGDISAVYQNFSKDIFGALKQAHSHLSKYHTLKLIVSAQNYFPVEILNGFKLFCHQYGFSCKVVRDINKEPIAKGEVFINLIEDDLVILLERIIASKLKAGKEIGVISYNETPLKKVLMGGITTISTDFKYMGVMAAKIKTENFKQNIEIPFHFVHRASL